MSRAFGSFTMRIPRTAPCPVHVRRRGCRSPSPKPRWRFHWPQREVAARSTRRRRTGCPEWFPLGQCREEMETDTWPRWWTTPTHRGAPSRSGEIKIVRFVSIRKYESPFQGFMRVLELRWLHLDTGVICNFMMGGNGGLTLANSWGLIFPWYSRLLRMIS